VGKHYVESIKVNNKIIGLELVTMSTFDEVPSSCETKSKSVILIEVDKLGDETALSDLVWCSSFTLIWCNLMLLVKFL